MNGERPQCSSFFTPDNQEFFLGALPPRVENGRVLYNAPNVGSAVELIPRSEWRPTKRRLKSIPILDQNGHGACVSYATVIAVMKARAKAGMSFVQLAPTWVYAWGNGGRDAGMVISDAADIIRNKGIPTIEKFSQQYIYKNGITDAAVEEAKSRFLTMDVYKCASFDEIMTAVILGWDVVYGITVGSGFNDLDSDGVPGYGFARGGHALTDSEEIKQRAGSSDWLLGTRNSWNVRWGLNGFCYLSEKHFDITGYIDAYAIRSVMTDPKETNTGRVAVI